MKKLARMLVLGGWLAAAGMLAAAGCSDSGVNVGGDAALPGDVGGEGSLPADTGAPQCDAGGCPSDVRGVPDAADTSPEDTGAPRCDAGGCPGDTGGTPDADDTASPEDTGILPGDGGLCAGDLPCPSDAGTGDGDAQAYYPFALCGKDSPCPFAEESFCVVLTEGDQGVCTRKCTPGGTECPPWLTCVALDPDKPEVGACFDVVDPGAGTCDPMAGKVCPNGLQCALVEEGTEGVCASYCSIGESLCPEGLECTPVEPGQVEWGMCLAKDDVPECWGDNNCEGLAVCVTLSDGFAGCVPQCVEDGEPCEDFGMCVTYPGPDGAVIGCLDIQKEGEICDPKKGLPCEDGLSCASVAGDALWKRCLAPCEGGQCGVGFLCQTGEGLPPEGMCVSVDLALSEPEACNPDFPCKDASSVCVSVPGSVNGVCAPPCSAGCPAGTGCRDGGCVAVAPAGAPCVESKGLFCVQGTACIRDAGENGTGYCAVLCNAGDDTVCKAPDVCLETVAGAYCLTSAGPGGKCSLDDGTGCDGAAGDLCVKMAASADAGYCAGKCDGPGSGTCVADKPLLIECVVKKGAQYYCGYLCGMAGAECPPDLTCSGMGLCIP